MKTKKNQGGKKDDYESRDIEEQKEEKVSVEANQIENNNVELAKKEAFLLAGGRPKNFHQIKAIKIKDLTYRVNIYIVHDSENLFKPRSISHSYYIKLVK